MKYCFQTVEPCFLGLGLAENEKILFYMLSAAGFFCNVNAQEYVVPRTPDDHPDLQGVWQAVNTAVWDIQDHSSQWGVPAGQGVVIDNELPYQVSALDQRKLNYENRFTDDPEANCKMVGVPRVTYMPYPFQIIQTPNQIVMTYEWVHSIRNIYMIVNIRKGQYSGIWATPVATGMEIH